MCYQRIGRLSVAGNENPSRAIALNDADPIPVKLMRTKRLQISRWSFAFLGLALAVFTWGLQYKLSLYAPPRAASHRMAKAKLIFKDESAQLIERVSLPDDEAPPQSFHSGEEVVLLPMPDVAIRLESRAIECGQRPARSGSLWASSSIVFFRPPPAAV
jgi:hypothetical protein